MPLSAVAERAQHFTKLHGFPVEYAVGMKLLLLLLPGLADNLLQFRQLRGGQPGNGCFDFSECAHGANVPHRAGPGKAPWMRGLRGGTTILGGKYPKFRRAYESFRRQQTDAGLANGNPA